MRDSQGFHKFAPKLWRKTHQITGDHVLDASIERSKNKDLPARLETHISDSGYGPTTGYNGYSHGDS